MSVGSPTAGTWSSSQWWPDNEFETDRILSVGLVRASDDSCNNAVAHWRALEGLRGQPVVGREAERADIGGYVGPFHDVPVLVRGEARGDEVLGGAGLVDGGDGAVARASERPGAHDDFVQHHLKVEARADGRLAAPRSRPPSGRDQASVLLLPPAARRRVIRLRPARCGSVPGSTSVSLITRVVFA